MLGKRKEKKAIDSSEVAPAARKPAASQTSSHHTGVLHGVPKLRSLGEALVYKGVITQEHIGEALAKQRETGGFVGQILVELGYITQDTIVSFLVKECKIPHLSLLDYEVSEDLLNLIPEQVCIAHNLLPIDKLGKILTVAMVDPLDAEALALIRKLCPDLRIKPILCNWLHFQTVSQRLFRKHGKSSEKVTADSMRPAASGQPEKTELQAVVDQLLADANTRPQWEPSPAKAAAATPHPSPQSSPAPAAPGPAAGLSAEELTSALRDMVQETVATMAGQLRAAASSGESAATGPSAQAEAASVAETNLRDLTEADKHRRRDRHASVRPFRSDSGPAGELGEGDKRVFDALGSEKPLEGFTFDGFFAGTTNAFTYKLSQAVAASPGTEYNPFFLYGNVGVGKTHLVNAIGNAICTKSPDKRVGYVSASHFARHLSQALQEQALDLFRENYCHWDVLILDDIQFLGGRIEAQEEFFHIFNVLHQEGRQIIIASDKSPDKLGLLEQRLVSRFAGGIVAQLKPPEMETRMAILRHQIEQAKTAVPDEILSLVAMRVPNDVRMMVGGLHKIVAFANLVGQDISYEMAAEILSHLGIVEAA